MLKSYYTIDFKIINILKAEEMVFLKHTTWILYKSKLYVVSISCFCTCEQPTINRLIAWCKLLINFITESHSTVSQFLLLVVSQAEEHLKEPQRLYLNHDMASSCNTFFFMAWCVCFLVFPRPCHLNFVESISCLLYLWVIISIFESLALVE